MAQQKRNQKSEGYKDGVVNALKRLILVIFSVL